MKHYSRAYFRCTSCLVGLWILPIWCAVYENSHFFIQTVYIQFLQWAMLTPPEVDTALFQVAITYDHGNKYLNVCVQGCTALVGTGIIQSGTQKNHMQQPPSSWWLLHVMLWSWSRHFRCRFRCWRALMAQVSSSGDYMLIHMYACVLNIPRA